MGNTVQKIKAMSKVLKVHSTDLKALNAMYVRGLKRNKRKHNRIDLICLFLMSKVSKVPYTIYIHSMVNMSEVLKVHSNYTVDYNSNSSNYIKI